MDQELLKSIIARVLEKISDSGLTAAVIHPEPIPIGISNRHLHLSQVDLETLFGANYSLQKQKELKQPGQYAAIETVILAGPKGCLERVRVLGPVRKQTQVEISLTDAFRLGVNPPLRESGDLMGSSGVTVIGPRGNVQLKEGLIIARRHIHMTSADALRFGVTDGAAVQVRIDSKRGMILDDVTVRVNPQFMLELHLDTDEANAAAVNQDTMANLYSSSAYQGKNVSVAGQHHSMTLENPEIVNLVTEETVRRAWKNKTNIMIKEGTPVTPLARDILRELGIKLMIH